MTHRVMILGTLFEMVEITKLSRQRGYYTVVCDGNPDGPARAFADRDYTVDVRDTEQIAAICIDEQIDQIITSFSDLMFECMVRIAAKAGIPCYVKEEAVDLYRQKTQTKALCAKLGIGVPRFELLREDFEDAQIADFRFPCIVKPADSYGSRGLRVVSGIGEVRDFFGETAAYSRGGTVLLEEISRGQELNCMGFLADGKVYMLSIADRLTAPFGEGHIPVVSAIHYPGRYTQRLKDQVREILQKFADATGQQWGPISTQCFYDGERIEICEIAGRMFGFEYKNLAYFAGLDVPSLLLDLLFDRERLVKTLKQHDPQGSRYSSVIYLNTRYGGTIGSQENIRGLCARPFVKESHLFFEEGEETGQLGPRPYFAMLYVQADTQQALEAYEEEIWANAEILDDKGRDLTFHPDMKCLLQK